MLLLTVFREMEMPIDLPASPTASAPAPTVDLIWAASLAWTEIKPSACTDPPPAINASTVFVIVFVATTPAPAEPTLTSLAATATAAATPNDLISEVEGVVASTVTSCPVASACTVESLISLSTVSPIVLIDCTPAIATATVPPLLIATATLPPPAEERMAGLSVDESITDPVADVT